MKPVGQLKEEIAMKPVGKKMLHVPFLGVVSRRCCVHSVAHARQWGKVFFPEVCECSRHIIE